jgi:predicted MFS family arabinose efflux permease
MHAWLGAGAGPVAVLAGLNMVDEFDRIAFSALSPEIRDAFGLSDAAILMLNVLPGLVILLTAGMIGWVTDRYSRIHVSMVAALAWAVASVLTGVVTSLLLLIVVRTISGLGRTANEIVHPSLIADLYPEKTHPRAYLVHRLGNPIAQASGVLAGWIATQWSWKWAFVVLALPTFVLLILLSRLRDPGRRKAAEPTEGNATKVGKTSMVDAFRVLRTIRSMRRLWVAATMLGAASFGIFSLASLYFEHQFDLGKQGRGFVQFLIGAGWVTGVGIGGVLAQRGIAAERYERLVLTCAASFLLIAIGGVALAASPVLLLSYAVVVVLALGNGIWQAPFFSSVARIAPPGLSGQAFGSATTAYAIGGFLTILIALASDNERERVGFVLVALFGLGAALAARSVATTIRADLVNADFTLR